MKTKSALLALALAAAVNAHAQSVPALMNFQSTVTDANGVRIGASTPENRDITLRIYDAAQGGTILYTEHQIATIANGDFSLLLGAGDAVGAEPHGSLQAAFSGPTRYLGVTVDDGTAAADVEISPRQQIVATAFAFAAQSAQTVPAANVLASLGANGLTTAGARLGINAPDIASQPPAGTYRLTVRGDNTDPGALANQLVVQSEASSGHRKLFLGYHNSGNYGSIQSYDEDVGPNKLVLNPVGGNVGIGVTSPVARLHVQATSPGSTLALQAAATGSTWADQLFYDRAGTIRSALQMIGANGDIMAGTQTGDFFARSTARLFLQSGISTTPGAGITVSTDNRVGMNAVAPAAQLDVFANGVPAALFNNGTVGIGVDAAGAARPLTVSGTGPQVRVRNSGTQTLDIAVEATGGAGSGGAGHASIQATDGINVRALRLNPLGGPVAIGSLANDGTALSVKGVGPQFKIISPTNDAHRLEIAAITAGGANEIALGTLQVANEASTGPLSLNPNGGNVGVGTSAPAFKLEVAGNFNVQLSGTTGVSADAAYGLQSVGDDYRQFRILRPGVGEWRVFCNGFNDLVFAKGGTDNTQKSYISGTTGAYTVLSDRRVKHDIQPLHGVLERVMRMRPVSYRFNAAPDAPRPSLGFIAQEVEPLFPEVVSDVGPDRKGMAYSELVPVAIGAIQEVNTETRQLKQENDTLKKQVGGLEERLRRLEALLDRQAAPTAEKAE